jgi:hypothetical protein
MTELPPIDRHAITVSASPGVTWDALCAVVVSSFGSPRTARIARALGCVPHSRSDGTSGPLSSGATLPGFAVVVADPGATLALEGRHRFSRYRLTFTLEPVADNACRLTAITDAAFPGALGAVYRMLVIGTRAHVLVTRRLLAAMRRRATR